MKISIDDLAGAIRDRSNFESIGEQAGVSAGRQRSPDMELARRRNEFRAAQRGEPFADRGKPVAGKGETVAGQDAGDTAWRALLDDLGIGEED